MGTKAQVAVAALAAVSIWTCAAPTRAQAPPAAAAPDVAPTPARMPAGASPPYILLLPSELPWEPGQPIVPGYVVTRKRRSSLILTGALMLGAVWTGNVIYASLAVADTRGANILGSSESSYYAPLFAPIVGPFIALRTLGANGINNVSAVGEFWLAMDGIVQTAGATLLIVGLAASKQVLVPSITVPGGAVSLVPTPVHFSGGGQGFGLAGTF